MGTANDFLQNLQKATVKSTVQQKQKNRPNASAAELSQLLKTASGQMATPRKSETMELVQENRKSEKTAISSDAAALSKEKVAASSFLQGSVARQGLSTIQKAEKPKLQSVETKEFVDAGIADLIQKALAAKEKAVQEVSIVERIGGMQSEFEAVFQGRGKEAGEGFVSTASFRRTNGKEGKLNVAAYIRVSTDMSDQENSYETQERYFNQLIESNPEWNPIGVYSDYGISGTVKEKRVGFRRLLRHCKEVKRGKWMDENIERLYEFSHPSINKKYNH